MGVFVLRDVSHIFQRLTIHDIIGFMVSHSVVVSALIVSGITTVSSSGAGAGIVSSAGAGIVLLDYSSGSTKFLIWFSRSATSNSLSDAAFCASCKAAVCAASACVVLFTTDC